MKRAIIPLAILVAAAGLAGWWLLAGRPPVAATFELALNSVASRLGFDDDQSDAALVASGFIEADEATVATELGGRIVAIHADEGDAVTEGQPLVELDDALLLAQIEQAEADLAAAEAALDKVKAGVRPETLAHAEAVLKQAETGAEAGRVAWEDAEAIRDNPQQIELALLAAQNQLGVLDLQTRQAEAMANSAQAGRELADTAVQMLEDFEPFDEWVLVGSYTLPSLPADIPLPDDLKNGEYRWRRYRIVVHGSSVEVWYLAAIRLPGDALTNARYEQATATYQSWQAWTGLAQAQAALGGTEAYAGELAAQAANPLTLEAKANAAESQYKVALASVEVARAQVEGLRMGATPEQIAAAEAQVELARAAVDALRANLAKFRLSAPLSGLVLERPVHVGEMAVPGAPLLTLADLDNLTLTVYVPASKLGLIGLGQPAAVKVDAYPDRTFTGTVAYIGHEAEFTPKNVQTQEERVNMVFAVKIRLPNTDYALKPGMPADATLADTGGDER